MLTLIKESAGYWIFMLAPPQESKNCRARVAQPLCN